MKKRTPTRRTWCCLESVVESTPNASRERIAGFRGAPADCDYGEDDTDSFLAFIDDLERSDRAADPTTLGLFRKIRGRPAPG